LIGIVYPEHRIDGAIVCLKYCEQCGCPFTRAFAPTEAVETRELEEIWEWADKGAHTTIGNMHNRLGKQLVGTRCVTRRRDQGQRYCRRCLREPVEAAIARQENYRAQLPGTEGQMRHSTYLPRYDESLVPVARRTQAHQISRTPRPATAKRLPRAEMLRQYDEWTALVRASFRERGRLTTGDLQDMIPRAFTLGQVHACMRQAFPALRRVGVTGAPNQGGQAIYELPGVSPPLSIATPEPELYRTARETVQ
jgi:hypothetical protein